MALSLKRNANIFGDIHIGPGQTWASVCWVFIFASIVIAAFLLSAKFSRREQVNGFLIANPQIMRINAPRPGRIQRIVVHEGQRMKRGDVLIYVDPDPSLVNGRPAAESEIDRIKVAESELRSRVQSIGSQVGKKVTEYTERIDAVAQQVVAVRSGVELQQQTIAVLKEQLSAGRTLRESGAMSVTEIQRRETALRDAEISVQTLLYSLHENEATLAELRGLREQAPIEGELRISDLRQSLIELGQRRTEAEGRMAFQVTAPVDGTVDTILVAPGQTVDPSLTMISLLPETSVLVAEMYVPSKVIAFVEPHQPVRIAYDAFPYVRYGFAAGKVASVSETILRSDELRKTISLAEPSYRVTVSIENQTMRSGDREIPLRPGLTLSADIILDRQTLAQWILRSVRELWARV
ncbi:MAG: HlyD family efflux transporter periplasmic adaptor subunit [Mesorhizobium sp.]|nr:MAG: HlyD family efflux transporter periplasmic adaptor subunit [Mesorhizobium sp.]